MANRRGCGKIDPMRIILLAICTLTLLAATGCFFPGGRDHDDHGHWQGHDNRDGVDHGEHPGDHDHNDNH
jgi:hypothetical protein